MEDLDRGDEMNMNMGLAVALEKEGYEVASAYSPRSGAAFAGTVPMWSFWMCAP
jgi:hypothetical protein